VAECEVTNRTSFALVKQCDAPQGHPRAAMSVEEGRFEFGFMERLDEQKVC
jgi:hypothetical protein